MSVEGTPGDFLGNPPRTRFTLTSHCSHGSDCIRHKAPAAIPGRGACTMSDDYTDGEVRQIVAEAQRGASLEALHCPRDRTMLRVFFSEFRSDVTNEPVQGVLCDDWGDVTEISVECPLCSASRARASLRRK